MTVTADDFVKHLVDSGLLDADEIERLLRDHEGKDGLELARELVRARRLTKYQAAMICQGKTRGLVLGNYVVLDKLGQGGMGMVYKARHRRMDRLVAIKVLSPQATARSPQLVQRFQREVKAAAQLQHPNIVLAHDADEAGGVRFLVMEYVEGKDLARLVKDSGPLPMERAIDYVTQAARGLQYAHAKGIVHRDIKPSNLLLDARGVVKVLDMGIARMGGDSPALHGADPQDGLTQTGTIVGTPDFMAPEQAVNSRLADARADVYSLGCVLYYLLTGKTTYDGETVIQKLLAHREQAIPSLAKERNDVPRELEEVFRRMVAKHPGDRFQTMTAALQALEQLRSGLLASSPCGRAPAGEARRTPNPEADTLDDQPPPALQGGWTPRRIALVAAGASVALLLSLISVLALGQAVRRAQFKSPSPHAGTSTRSVGENLSPTAPAPPAAKPVRTNRVLLVLAHKGYYPLDYINVKTELDRVRLGIDVASTMLGPGEPYVGDRPGRILPRVPMPLLPSANVLLKDTNPEDYDAIIVLGFDGNAFPENSIEGQRVRELVQSMHESGKPVAGISAGPTVLADAGLLRGKEATCLPRCRAALESGGAIYRNAPVVRADRVLTAQNSSDADELVQALIKQLSNP